MPTLVSHPDEVKVISRRFGQGAAEIDRYLELDGYKAVQKAIAQGPEKMASWIIDTMKASGLRRRGGGRSVGGGRSLPPQGVAGGKAGRPPHHPSPPARRRPLRRPHSNKHRRDPRPRPTHPQRGGGGVSKGGARTQGRPPPL